MLRPLLLSVVLAACAPPAAEPTAPERVAIIVAERSSSGARLVAIDEHGDRQFEVAYPPRNQLTRDTHPAVSPDGKMLLFTSNRVEAGLFAGKSHANLADRSSKIWLYTIDAAPAFLDQVTYGPSIETDPTWAPDGGSFVFASTLDDEARKNGTNFNLFRVGLARKSRGGKQLTFGPRHEVSPSFAPDGSIIYASAALDSFDSHLERVAPDGTITQVTSGHGEGAPAVSPDGNWIAYTCQQTTLVDRPRDAPPADAPRTVVATIQHRDLCVRPFSMPADSTATIEPIVSLPPSDEEGPVWSRDGRYLFATSAVWGENGVLFSSVIFIDMTEHPRKARILLDRGGPAPRMTPAIATGQLISADLAQNPEYLSSLVRIMAKRIQQQILEERNADSAAGSAPP